MRAIMCHVVELHSFLLFIIWKTLAMVNSLEDMGTCDSVGITRVMRHYKIVSLLKSVNPFKKNIGR